MKFLLTGYQKGRSGLVNERCLDLPSKATSWTRAATPGVIQHRKIEAASTPSHDYQPDLQECGLICSMNRAADFNDNAPRETVRTPKGEAPMEESGAGFGLHSAQNPR